MSILELFRLQTQIQAQLLADGVRALESDPAGIEHLGTCIHAARLFRGMACITDLHAGADLAHAMEDCFAAALRGDCELHAEQMQWIRRGVTLLDRLARLPSDAGRISAVRPAQQQAREMLRCWTESRGSS